MNTNKHHYSGKSTGKPKMLDQKIDSTLRLIAWEFTQKCNLNCLHCRGSATSTASSEELSLSESRSFIDSLEDFNNAPIVIFSGGEPLIREDSFEVIEYASHRGLRVVLATNGVLVDHDKAKTLKKIGVQRASISLDGSNEESHDSFRGLTGAFRGAMAGIEELKRVELPFQINTTITRRNLDEIEDIAELAIRIKAQALHIFLLVPTGRGKDLEGDAISAAEYEKVLRWFHEFGRKYPIQVKATCAPHYYRIVHQLSGTLPASHAPHGLSSYSRGCLGGTGFCFVSYKGDVCPCGYLPLVAGNIREQRLSKIWAEAPLFLDLRNPDKLKGKCGRCEYRWICGGCRARAYTMSGDHLAEEPLCIYHPRGEGKRGEV
jgi:AdoMet-dependent heme synthase